MQVELKLKYKFRLILDESWSYGILGRTGRGVTEAQNVDAKEVDMIIGSLSASLCGAGGFCASSEEVVEHQRISSASYTYSAALPALLATTASETIAILQEQPEVLNALRENIKAMRAQLDPRSDWVQCTSMIENPVMILRLKPEVVASKNLSYQDQQQLFQDVMDEVCHYLDHCLLYIRTNRRQCLANGVLITRIRSMPLGIGENPRDQTWQPTPALKVCVTSGLSKKETERAGVIIRHAITKIVTRRK
jgi:serine palmitoyltransferase